jgi:hypothetical protein
LEKSSHEVRHSESRAPSALQTKQAAMWDGTIAKRLSNPFTFCTRRKT